MKQQSKRGKQLRSLASMFENIAVGSRRKWKDSIKRLKQEAATADKAAGNRKRTQLRHLKELRKN